MDGTVERYGEYLRSHKNRKALFLELGAGMNTPGIIKFPFWQMVHDWSYAAYACINLNEACTPEDILKKSICINDDIGTVLKQVSHAVTF